MYGQYECTADRICQLVIWGVLISMSTSASLTKYINDFLGFLSVERGSSSNTLSAYRNDMNQFVTYLEERLSGKGIGKITRSDVQDFILHLKGRGYTESSVARKVASVRSFFFPPRRRRMPKI